MPTKKVYDMTGKEIGEVTLSENVFGVEPNIPAIHTAVKNHLANRRQGTQSTLTRAEVSGGGAKPYRQKGTGRARQGTTRAPHYTHGGVAFAPKPRDYSYTINKKLKRIALKSALSLKAAEERIIVVDKIEVDEIKTKDFVKFLDAVGVTGKALVVTPEVNKNVILSARNIPGVKTTFASLLNTYDIMNATAFVVDKAALSTIEEVYA
jgi:large subunit ribosomal protein L4